MSGGQAAAGEHATAPREPRAVDTIAASDLDVQRHPLLRRLAHWLMAFAIIVLIASGWRIYDASPIFGFRFPLWPTLGGNVDAALVWNNDPGTGSAIAWHFAAIWLLLAAFLLFVGHGVLTGHFWRDYLPVTPKSFLRDFVAAARFRLAHRLSKYNSVQKAFYWGVLLGVTMMFVSGLAIWKPVQMAPLTALLGGFQTARLIHFLFMTALALFLVVHVVLVVLVPKTFVAMTLGRASARPHDAASAPGAD